MHAETCNLLRHTYFNPMEYTVCLIRKKIGLVYPVPAWLFKSSKKHFAMLP